MRQPGSYLIVLLGVAVFTTRGLAGENPAAHGEYLFRAAGCAACHTDKEHGGPVLAGGRRIDTPFGIFYSPNITPDQRHGIGAWSSEQFVAALRHGVSPQGQRYYPVFPYPSYAAMRRADMLALWAYLQTVPTAARANRLHQLPWYLRTRLLNRLWQFAFFRTRTYRDNPARSPSWNRGAYLVQALAHCPQCHTPRTPFGSLDLRKPLAGTKTGPDGDSVPNITPDLSTGIGSWSRSELREYLTSGLMPDGDTADGLMAEVIDDGLSYLRRDDVDAIITYLRSLKPIRNQVREESSDAGDEF
ncbi:MAG: c-type cytochrome [Gammaproteobacteria bacterium]